MKTLVITVTPKKGQRITSLRKAATKAMDSFSFISAIKVVPTSRGDRLSEAESTVEDAKSEVESLRDELQDWYDNLPEQFQSGEKGDQLQEAIDGLESIANSLQDAEWDSVEFPSMY